MKRLLILSVLLPACSFKVLGGDTDPLDDPSGGDEILGGSTTSGGSITGNATTEEVPAGTTSEPPGTTTSGGMITGNATTTGGESTVASESSGEPLPAPLQVYVLHAEPGPHSGFEEVALWQSGNVQTCEDAPPVSCEEAPVVGVPKVIADGALVGPDAVQSGSRVGVIFPYAHPECAIGCGKYTAEVLIGNGGDGGAAIGVFPVDLPCSTEEGFVWLGVDFNVVAAQPYSAELVLTDRCGASSEAQKVVFTPT